MDEPPVGVDATVWNVLQVAHAQRARVTIALRGDAARGQPVRLLVGRPVRFDLNPRGQLYVALDVAEGTELRVLVARIAWARRDASEDSGVVARPATASETPTAVVLGDDAVLRELLVTALALDNWHAEPLGLADVSAAALAQPAVVALVCAPRRTEASLAAAGVLRAAPTLDGTPLLVAARAQCDVAPSLRALPRTSVLVAPFGVAEIRDAITTLLRLPRRTGSGG